MDSKVNETKLKTLLQAHFLDSRHLEQPLAARESVMNAVGGGDIWLAGRLR